MSHVTSSLVVITDLECLKLALKKFPKLKWKEGVTNYSWFGSFLDDWSEVEKTARERGIDPKQYGKAEHVIHVAGCDYEIGVTKREDGQGYSLVWDTYGPGAKISTAIGNDAEKLMIEYQQHYIRQFADANGMMLDQTVDSDGNIVINLNEA